MLCWCQEGLQSVSKCGANFLRSLVCRGHPPSAPAGVICVLALGAMRETSTRKGCERLN